MVAQVFHSANSSLVSLAGVTSQFVTSQLKEARWVAQRKDQSSEKEILTERLEKLLEVLPSGVVILDEKGVIRSANPAAKDFFGAGIEGKAWLDIIENAFAPKPDDGHEISLKDGRRVSISTQGLYEARGQLILITDLTETRKLQEAASQKERLAMLGQTVASLAHQIRTPLASASLYISEILNHAENPLLIEKYASRVQRKMQDLERQVQDMLLFSRKEIPLHDRADLKTLIEECAQAAEAILKKKNILLKIELSPDHANIPCNRKALLNAMISLIENAIEASRSGSVIYLRGYVQAHENSTLRNPVIEVEDEGVGIDQADIETLCQPFYTTKDNGTGLGLSIVKLITQSHQAKLEVRSEPNRGCKIRLIFPAQ